MIFKRTNQIFLILMIVNLWRTQSTSNNCSTGCISCSPLNYCQLCDNSKLLVLQTQIDLNLPYPHKITSCVATKHLNCAKVDYEDNCIYCQEGYYPKAGVCTEAVVKVPACLILTHNGICAQCIDNYVLDISGNCVVVNPEETAGEGCSRIRNNTSKCIECKESYLMDDLGKCILEDKVLPLSGKGLSTLMFPEFKSMSNCQFISRYECKSCSSSSLTSSNDPDYNLFNSVGAIDILSQNQPQKLDIDALMKYETPFVISLFNSDTSLLNLEKLENSELYCKSNPIANCLIQDPYKCLMCKNGYEMTSVDFCEKSENPPIPNCEVQLTVLKCLKCKNGFFNSHLNLTFCKESSKVENCKTYQSKSDGCKECDSGFLMLNGQCSKRIYTEIENCEVLRFEDEGCSKCFQNYVLSPDYLGCFAKIPNCDVHQTGLLGLKGRKGLLCIECASGYFLDFSSGHSVEDAPPPETPDDSTTPDNTGGDTSGTNIPPPTKVTKKLYQTVSVENSETTLNVCSELPSNVDQNCELFSKESIAEGNDNSTESTSPECQKCKNGYFLDTSGTKNICSKYPNDIFENCAMSSGFTNKKCLFCDYQSIILKTKDLCLPPTIAKNCKRFKSSSDCETCFDNFFGEDCLPIPEEMNCKRIENEGSGLNLTTVLTARCAECKDGHWQNLSGTCKAPNDFESKFCDGFYNSGDKFLCKKCSPISLIFDYEDKSICLSKDSNEFTTSTIFQQDFDSILGFCRKTKFDPIIEKYFCLSCVESRVMDDRNGKCEIPDLVENTRSRFAFINTFYDIQPTNELLRKKTYIRNFWIDYDRNSFLDIDSKDDGAHFLNPIDFTIYNKSTPASDLAKKDFFDLYLEGCKYFVPVNNSIVQQFVCAKCKAGYLTINDFLSEHTGYVYKTTLFNLVPWTPEHEGSIPWSAEESYEGSPVNRFPGVLCQEAAESIEIEKYSNLNCERYLVNSTNDEAFCQKCIEGYHGKLIEKPNFYNMETISGILRCERFSACDRTRVSGLSYRTDYDMSKLGLNWEAYSTCGKCQHADKVLVLRLKYVTSMNSIQPSGNDVFNTECLHTTDDIAELVNDPSDIIDGCSLYIHMLNEADPDKQKYCGSCLPGYKAVSFWPYTDTTNNSNTSSDGNLGRVASCTVIENCEGYEWMNSCSKCSDGFIWEYDKTLNRILYDKCITLPANVGLCRAGFGNECFLCQKGYTLNQDNICETFGAPLCAHFDSNNYSTIANLDKEGVKINNFLQTDWSSLQYYFIDGEGCVDCYDNYISNEVPFWGYWESNLYCTYSNNLEKIELSEGSLQIQGLNYNCLKYGFDYTNKENICRECKENFVLGENGDCDPIRDTLTGCVLNVSAGSDVCKECGFGYFLNNDKCFKKEVDDCQTYNSSGSFAIKCVECKSGFYLDTSTGLCHSGFVKGCNVYRDDNFFECIECQEGQVLLENNLSKIYENKREWDLIGRTWKQKQPFWDYWVHVLFSNAQKIDMAKRTACVKMNGIKCRRGRIVSVDTIENSNNEIFGTSNDRDINGFHQLFVSRVLLNGGKSIVKKEELVFECLECGDGYWKTKTDDVNIFSEYSIDETATWEKGDDNIPLSLIEGIALRIDKSDNYLKNCSEIKKLKECVVQDSGAINSLSQAFVKFSGALNLFGKDFLMKMRNGSPLVSLLDEFGQLDLKYEISNKYEYNISDEEILKLENWLRNNSINLFADFKIFLTLSESLENKAKSQGQDSLLSSAYHLNQEDHEIYLGNDTGRAISSNSVLEFFRSSSSLSEWKCIECIEGMYSENGLCKLRRNSVENCETLEPDSDGFCLRCNTGYLLSENKQCSFLSTSTIENCIEFELDKCVKCRIGYLLNSSGLSCEQISDDVWVENCYRQNQSNNCLQCRFGHRFNWNQKCYPVDGHGYCWDYRQKELDGCFSCQPFTFLFNGSDTISFCSAVDIDSFTADSGYNDHIDNFLEKYVTEGFMELEYKLRKNQTDSLSSIYSLSYNQQNDVADFKSDRANCLLFDPHTPFNCITCHEGYILNIQTKLCETSTVTTTNCVEFIDSVKDICVRCKKGYVLDYGINKNIFEEDTELLQSPSCVSINEFSHVTTGDSNCENSVIHNEYKCVNCKNGFYFDFESGNCETCPQSNCKICSNKDSHRCLICESGYHNNVEGSCIKD